MPGIMSGPTVNALIRRGLSPNLLMQQAPLQSMVTPGSANFNPSMITPPNNPMPDRSPITDIQHNFMRSVQAPSAPVAPNQQPASPVQQITPKSEAEMISGHLGKRLEALSKHEETKRKFMEAILAQAIAQQQQSAGPSAVPGNGTTPTPEVI